MAANFAVCGRAGEEQCLCILTVINLYLQFGNVQ